MNPPALTARRGISWWLFVIGLLLVPFSTGTEVAVMSYGLPALLVLNLCYIVMQIQTPVLSSRQQLPAGLGLLLIVAITATSLYAPEPQASFARVAPNIIGFLVFLYLLSPFYQGDRMGTRFESVAKVYVASATIVAFYYLINFIGAVNEIGLAGVFLDRVTGGIISLPWGATNVVASVLLLPMLLTFYFGVTEPRKKVRAYYFIARTAMVATILMTQSRGAMLSGAFGLVLLALFFKGRDRRRLLTFVAITWLLWTLFDRWVSSIMAEQVISEIVARFSGDDISSLNGRVEIWQQFATEFWNSPLIGSGYYSTLYTIGSSGHNLVLTTVIERGLIGLALSAGILLKAAEEVVRGFFRANTQNTRLFFACLGAGGAASMLHLMVEDANFTQQYIVYSWVALALVFQAVEVLPDAVPEKTPILSQPTLIYKT